MIADPNRSNSVGAILPYILSTGLLFALIWIQMRIGGTRLVYAIPGYALIAIVGVVSLPGFKNQKAAPSGSCLFVTIGYFGYLLLRTLFSPSEYLARTNLYLILASLIVYFLVATQLCGIRQRLILLGGFCFLEIGHLALGLLQMGHRKNYLPFGCVRPDYGTRISGYYASPSQLAGFLECMALMLICLALFSRVRTWIRILLLYLSGSALVGVFLTGSRSGYLSALAGLFGLIIFGFIYCRQLVLRRWPGFLLVGVLILGAAGVLFYTHQGEFISQQLGSAADSREMRIFLWKAGVRQFEQNPIVGTGSGTYLVYGRKFRDASIQSDPVYAHNDYLQLLGEYGIIGGILFLTFMGAHVVNAVFFLRWLMKRLKESGDNSSSSLAMVSGALLSVVALSLHSIFNFNLQVPGNTLMVAAFFGVLANPGVKWKEGPTFSWSGLLPAFFAIPLFVMATPKISPEVDSLKASLTLRSGDYALALAYAKRGAQGDPLNPDLFYYLAEARRRIGSRLEGEEKQRMLKAAAASFEQGLVLFPMDERLLVKAGLTNAQLGDFSKADQLLGRALEWSPNLGSTYAAYGLRYQLENKPAEAEAALAKAKELESNQMVTTGLQAAFEVSSGDQ